MKTRIVMAAFAVISFTGCTKKEVDARKEEAAGQHEENIVALTKENLLHVEVKVEPAALDSIETTLKAAGRVSRNMNKTAKVTSTLEGRIAKLNSDINDAVRTGDVLALIQTPELIGRPLELRAPIDGVVVERSHAMGELVEKANAIYTISDPTDLWVLAEIKEVDISAVKVGQEASFTVLTYPGETFHGKVSRIANQVETDSRTVEARIEVDNADRRLKPGMFADVEITTTVLNDVLVVPDSALQTDEDKQVVFIALDGNRFEKRTVRLGLERRNRVQILDGIKPGEKVVTEGSFILKSEMLKGELGEE